jgi:hypothetical protein
MTLSITTLTIKTLDNGTQLTTLGKMTLTIILSTQHDYTQHNALSMKTLRITALGLMTLGITK